MSEALLSVRNLSVEFTTYGRTQPVLRGVSLDVPARSHVALVGESGSGKTVTMKSIMGLLHMPPASISSGAILYDGRDLLTMSHRERLKLTGTDMSMVFQDPDELAQSGLHHCRPDDDDPEICRPTAWAVSIGA